jgi:hypothetical protein
MGPWIASPSPRWAAGRRSADGLAELAGGVRVGAQQQVDHGLPVVEHWQLVGPRDNLS